jgi:hypothetical protein
MWASLPFASGPEHCLPRIQFLFIGSRLCSTLLSGLTSRLGPCASLSLHLYQVVKRTFTSKLSIMLGVPNKNGEPDGSPFFVCCVVSEATLTARVFSGDAHRKSGVFSFGSALSPVESCSLQSLMSSRFSLLLRSPKCKRRDGEMQRRVKPRPRKCDLT